MSEKQKKSEIYDIYKDWECEKLNIKFCKYILSVNKKTTNLAVLAELGKFPIYIFTCILNFFSTQFLTTDKSICNLLTRAIIVENQDTKWSSYIFLHSSKAAFNKLLGLLYIFLIIPLPDYTHSSLWQ
jgi:hypothetical protein